MTFVKQSPPPTHKKSAQQARYEKRRQDMLDRIDEQVADGSLTIRKMTAAERKMHPKPDPKDAKKKR